MNSFLNAIKTCHVALATASATILLFVFTPNDVAAFQSAQREAQLLATVDYNAYAAWGIHLAEPAQKGAKRDIQQSFSNVSHNRWLGFSNTPFEWVPPFVPLPQHRATLQSLFDFFTQPSGIGLAMPSQINDTPTDGAWYVVASEVFKTGVCTNLDRRYRRACRDVPPPIYINDIEFLGPDMSFAPTPFYSHAPEKNAKMTVILDGGPISGWYTRANVTLVAISLVKVKPLTWLHAQPRLGTALVGVSKGQDVFLPNLRNIWNDVFSLTPDEAVTSLQEKIEASRKAITLFGLSVDQRAVLLVGPLAVLAAALYMFLLLQSLLKDLNTAAPLQPYPWIGLLQGRVSIAASCISILILPVTASSLLVWRYFNGLNLSSLIAISATVALAAVSLLTWRALIVLRPRFTAAGLSITANVSGD